MLKHRFITALILLPIVISAVFLSSTLCFAIVTLMICLLAAWEWGRLAGLTVFSQRIGLIIFFSIFLISLLLNFLTDQSSIHFLPFGFSLLIWLSLGWWIIALILVLTYPNSAVFWQHSSFLRIIFGILTIIPFFCGMLALRQYTYEQDHKIGIVWLFYLMLLVWGADSGAYIFGKRFGKHQLAPKISPGKTWEGLIGGLLVSTLISLLFAYYFPLGITYQKLFICSVISVFASILGDLTESMFKRQVRIKDSGYLIPGHGGILDRIDSLTAAVPVFACFMLFIF